MWHLLMADQQESFHPFSSRQSLSYFLSHVTKGSIQKSHGPDSHSSGSGSPLLMAAMPGFKSQRQSSSAAPFLTPATISYTCQHSPILPALLGCHISLGRRGPMAWSQSSLSSHTGAVTRGSCLPVTFWVEVTSIPLAHSLATAI